jgi:hypothetical protein
MEISEIMKALQEIADTFVPPADITALIGTNDKSGGGIVLIHPDGNVCHASVSVHGKTWEELISATRKRAEELTIETIKTAINSLAMAIIMASDDHGNVPEAALFRAGFSRETIAAYGQSAIGLAHAKTGNAPYRIVVEAKDK